MKTKAGRSGDKSSGSKTHRVMASTNATSLAAVKQVRGGGLDAGGGVGCGGGGGGGVGGGGGCCNGGACDDHDEVLMIMMIMMMTA